MYECGCFLSFSRLASHVMRPCVLSVAVIAVAFAVSFPAARELPTVGASGMCYALTGVVLAAASTGCGLRIKSGKRFAVFIAQITLLLFLSGVNPHSNILIHLPALAGGAAVTLPKALFCRRPGA